MKEAWLFGQLNTLQDKRYKSPAPNDQTFRDDSIDADSSGSKVDAAAKMKEDIRVVGEVLGRLQGVKDVGLNGSGAVGVGVS